MEKPTQKSRSVKSGKESFLLSKLCQVERLETECHKNNCKYFYEFPTVVLLTIITPVITEENFKL